MQRTLTLGVIQSVILTVLLALVLAGFLDI